MPLLLPCLGLILWLVHVVASLRGENLPWMRWAWVCFLPLAGMGGVLFWALFMPPPTNRKVYAALNDEFLLLASSVFLCFAGWITFLILEPFVSVVAHRARTRRANQENVDTSPPGD